MVTLDLHLVKSPWDRHLLLRILLLLHLLRTSLQVPLEVPNQWQLDLALNLWLALSLQELKIPQIHLQMQQMLQVLHHKIPSQLLLHLVNQVNKTKNKLRRHFPLITQATIPVKTIHFKCQISNPNLHQIHFRWISSNHNRSFLFNLNKISLIWHQFKVHLEMSHLRQSKMLQQTPSCRIKFNQNLAITHLQM